MRCKGIREGEPVDETHYYVLVERTSRCDTSLRTTAKALLQHVRDRWSIENSWHWPRDTQLRGDAHRYHEPNGVRILATLRSLGMNALRLADFWSIPRAWPLWPMTSGDFWHCWAGENRLRA